MKKRKSLKAVIHKRRHEMSMVLITFLVIGILFTIQMTILGGFINYTEIRVGYVIAIVAYWLAAAVVFTLLTVAQINRRYQKPMEQFADAASKVADGDFSVYVPSRSRPDRMDFLDAIFMDFNKMVEELGSIETLKTEFFSNVSHEIKTPLSVIQNYAEMLQKENLTPEQQQDYTNTILESSRRLSDLITNLLKLNKLEKQNITPVPEPYDLCRQLCECALLFEDQWEKKGIDFVVDIEDRAIINADATLLELVWNNLLSNAIKFSERGGTVTLTQTRAGNEVVVSVSDTGCGMSGETARHIFDKFYQGDTSHATEGNGLGLALVHRIIDLADGSIAVNSEPLKGSTFTVRLPVAWQSEEES